mmetsp:Transcript_100459/g.287609  ORF Transcript_100459/g.287609 Transcript_100459/m.287609 type:complete len:212 (-) Transcript_100459:925-1560(-)
MSLSAPPPRFPAFTTSLTQPLWANERLSTRLSLGDLLSTLSRDPSDSTRLDLDATEVSLSVPPSFAAFADGKGGSAALPTTTLRSSASPTRLSPPLAWCTCIEGSLVSLGSDAGAELGTPRSCAPPPSVGALVPAAVASCGTLALSPLSPDAMCWGMCDNSSMFLIYAPWPWRSGCPWASLPLFPLPPPDLSTAGPSFCAHFTRSRNVVGM